MSNQDTAAAPGGAHAKIKISIVLVHGAFVDGSGWKPVYDRLYDKGYEVLVVQHPTLTLEGDVAATERVIAKACYPVVLVGHSYGGAVVTQAGGHEKVKSVVYLAAFVPDAGESVGALVEGMAEPGVAGAPVVGPEDGFLSIAPGKFGKAFAADVDARETRFMAMAQLPWGLGAVTGEITRPAWKEKPTHYLVATADRMIPPDAQRRMATRAGARIAEVEASHALMLSRPAEVADFIAAAAN